MEKLEFHEWFGIIPPALMLMIAGFIWAASGFNELTSYLLIITLLLVTFLLTMVFAERFIEIGEKISEKDEKLLQLEKEHAAFQVAIIMGAGLAFLFAGLPDITTKPLAAMFGLILLITSNLIYNLFYYPKYLILITKRKNELLLNKNK